MSFRSFIVLGTIAAFALGACKRAPEPPAPEGSATPKATAPARNWIPWKKPTPTPAPTPPKPPPRIWESFNGEKAFLYVRKQTELGPRPAASVALEATRKLITDALVKEGWEVERQEFTEQTPRGPITFVNLIGRFTSRITDRPAPRDTQRAIVASHYDTKTFDTIEFVGAHDGASSTGALIELARVLALDWNLAKQVELVFFDGEEAFRQFDETDGLYGSRYYARKLRESGQNKQFKFGILWDMIGDRDLTITLSPDTPSTLSRGILAAAERLELRQHFRFYDRPIWDDHVPLIRSGIPTIDIIDFDYIYWHTADDTLDKLSPDSLEKVGKVTLYFLWTNLGLAPVSKK